MDSTTTILAADVLRHLTAAASQDDADTIAEYLTGGGNRVAALRAAARVKKVTQCGTVAALAAEVIFHACSTAEGAPQWCREFYVECAVAHGHATLDPARTVVPDAAGPARERIADLDGERRARAGDFAPPWKIRVEAAHCAAAGARGAASEARSVAMWDHSKEAARRLALARAAVDAADKAHRAAIDAADAADDRG